MPSPLHLLHLLHLLFVAPSLAALRIRCACILYLAILVLGSIPGARADIGHVASGAVLHSIAYAGLCLLVFGGIDASRARRAIGAVLTIAAMGALDETVQSFFPYRGAAVGDWLLDCGAALVTASALYLAWPFFAPAAVSRAAPPSSRL